jgi:hypothetical protein
MNQKVELYHDSRKALSKTEIILKKFPKSKWNSIRNEMEEKGLFVVHYLMDQIYLWMGPMTIVQQRKKGRMKFEDLGYYFGVNGTVASKLYEKGKNHIENDIKKGPGRPTKLNETQISEVTAYIIHMFNQKTPIRLVDLYEYVVGKYKLDICVSYKIC